MARSFASGVENGSASARRERAGRWRPARAHRVAEEEAEADGAGVVPTDLSPLLKRMDAQEAGRAKLEAEVKAVKSGLDEILKLLKSQQ